MKSIRISLLLLLLASTALAQKLPDVQESSLMAPANIRIDGKAGEWGNNFAAENKRISILYSLANDDKNLYLAIKAAGAATINKIMAGGITLNVNTEARKKEKESSGITYPLIKRAARGQQNRAQGMQMRGTFRVTPQQQTDAQRDSVALVQHKAQLKTAREIKVTGIKAVSDSLISIYNEYGIKAVASFDNEGAMIYELAIPLSLLELSVDKPKEFAYQIKLNGMSMNGFGVSGVSGVSVGGRSQGQFVLAIDDRSDLMSPTYFWGKYTPIKK